ncbi:MAG: hypothetical protein WAW41_17870 [Methylobacter sp.]
MSFSDDINKFVQKCGKNADQVIRKTVLDIGKSLIEKTPVGDPDYWQSPPPKGYAGGHARNNWAYSMGSLQPKQFDGVDPSGSASMGRITAGIPQKSAGEVHFIQNSVPYIQALEDGRSRQAPFGMVALTEIEFHKFITNAIGELK